MKEICLYLIEEEEFVIVTKQRVYRVCVSCLCHHTSSATFSWPQVAGLTEYFEMLKLVCLYVYVCEERDWVIQK